MDEGNRRREGFLQHQKPNLPLQKVLPTRHWDIGYQTAAQALWNPPPPPSVDWGTHAKRREPYDAGVDADSGGQATGQNLSASLHCILQVPVKYI